MKRIVVVMLVVFLVSGAVYAQDGLISGSFSTSTGSFFGRVDNATFNDQDGVDATEKKAYSRFFDETLVPYVAMEGQLNIGEFFIGGSALSALPLSGSLGVSGDANFPESDLVAIRSESNSESRLNNHVLARVGLGYAFRFGALSVTPAAGFTAQLRSWDGVNGTSLVQGKTEAVDVTGVYMTSAEVTLYPSIGLNVGYAVNDLLEVSGGGGFLPYVVSETKLQSRFPYIENQYHQFTGLGATGELNLLIHPQNLSFLALVIGCSYEGIYLTKGKVFLQAGGLDVPEASEILGYSATYNSTLFRVNLGVKVSL
jgi:hypothetical protein